MNFKKYNWDDVNIEHVAQHSVIPQEVEEACHNEPLIMKMGRNKYIIYGRSDSGRYLFMVTIYKGDGTIRAVTARDMTNSERRLYNRKRR
ncbi:MAG: BrnT family toxin [Candidatus Omnitrophica bacterium]|nr:BrnT family toxin [Candidatus Omnitrophota bacterium]MBU0896621.1 BrnT family toxin [Candidatus Omnitrophota bacterium]MBU1134400.1 BrnT family toxin [Candidatus Omnitrophota bacterium]MBU1366829.1 BrnT family toxin [Candidatus Omnitrophota bacterium]MBU1523896.1 BrnT family toxin [Candidatus Omnitrophota bacterium]